jgi:phosphatidylethanolamine-binding protein (PEBP) family uncharacterized protein
VIAWARWCAETDSRDVRRVRGSHAIERAMNGHALAEAKLVGTYAKHGEK